MKNNNILNVLIFLTLFSIFIYGCKVTKQEPVIETREEEIVDTGALVVESSPSLAEVYIGEEYRGNTPLTLYNIPVGQYVITIKKEGYADFKKTVIIKVGRTEEIDATLKPIIAEETKQTETIPEIIPQAPKVNKINLSSFAMYYDFDKMEFTEIRTAESDLFSRKYDTYVHFTALAPTKINVLNKPISEVSKEDCIFADTGVAPVFSAQTLCVKTGNGVVVAIGGVWQTMPNELEWKQFN